MKLRIIASIMGGMLMTVTAQSQDLSSKIARQEAFVSAVIYDDILSVSQGDEGQLGVKKLKTEAVAAADRITRQFLNGSSFTDIPKRHDIETRGLLFLMYYIGGTVPATSPCLSRETFKNCDTEAFPIEDTVLSHEFRRAYQDAQPKMQLPAIEAAFPFLNAE